MGVGISCNFKSIYDKECSSCGLTRGIAECFKGDFNTANDYNAQSFIFFIFILLQLIMRPFLLIFYKINQIAFKSHLKMFVICDVSIMIIFMLYLKINYG